MIASDPSRSDRRAEDMPPACAVCQRAAGIGSAEKSEAGIIGLIKTPERDCDSIKATTL